MSCLTTEPIVLESLLDRVRRSGAGAELSFAGVVRDHSRGRRVLGIEYHAYSEMAARQLERIEEEARARWPGIRIALLHRVGALAVGDASVAIAVSSAHRAEGFDALRFAIEEIKRQVPIWKKELYPDGHAWIEGS
jgi:molybdopterin synthase catalytic subunit